MRQQEKKTGPEIFACLPSWPCLPVSLPAHPLFWNHGSQAKQIRLFPDGSQPPYHRIRLIRRFPKNSQVLSQYYSVYISPFCISLSQRMLPDRFILLIIWFVPKSNFLPPLCLPKFAVSMPGFDCRVFHRKIGRSRLQSFSQLDHATQSIPPRTLPVRESGCARGLAAVPTWAQRNAARSSSHPVAAASVSGPHPATGPLSGAGWGKHPSGWKAPAKRLSGPKDGALIGPLQSAVPSSPVVLASAEV